MNDAPARRLSDKLLLAFEQATEQGRDEMAERLKLVLQALEEEEAAEKDHDHRRGEEDSGDGGKD